MIYQKEYLNEISFPIGGIGSGSIGLAGNGSFVDWEIFNRPDKGSINGYSHIAVKLRKNGTAYTKVLHSDLHKGFMGQYEKRMYRGFGYGPLSQTMSGVPHFRDCTFNGEFPIAKLEFTDANFPGAVTLTAFNPFIPLDSKNSSIPAGFYEITYRNQSDDAVEFQCAFSLANPFAVSKNMMVQNGDITAIKLINAEKQKDEADYGDLSLSCVAPSCVQKYWYRGGWQDGISSFWYEFSNTDGLIDRDYADTGSYDICSMLKSVTLAPGEEANIRFVVSWNIPNNYNYWDRELPKAEQRTWKNYYATIFRDSVESGKYALENWDDLYAKTKLFKDELYASTVDDVIKEAVSATISVLKSPTVFRLENGEFYGFEGVHEKEGSCEGTCQHVYNYAYALCFLFPDLERSIRELEFQYTTYESGGTTFRLKLPLGRKVEKDTSCVDGQMGCVIKTYREWKISGDNQWLESVWPTVEKILEYAWSIDNEHEWDKNKDGVLEGRQHHTLDMELFGPSSWLQGFYLGALRAAAEMAEFLGKHDKASEYNALFEKGKQWTKDNLFNGQYFIQQLDIRDKSITDHFGCSDGYWNAETGEIKYQIGQGSAIDQLTGQWHANICGLGEIFDNRQVKTALENMFKNNYKASLRDVANMWRVFALNDEGGTIICDYPVGVYKPSIPITYCEECMTGFEYQFAGLLMSEGFITEALQVVHAIRDRYDGKKRNPWNEIECGSNYVRAMASFALLPIISGFTFDLPHHTIGFNPLIKGENFRCMWSLGTGWGNVVIERNTAKINMKSGTLTLSQIDLPFITNVEMLIVDGKEMAFQSENGSILFNKTTIYDFVEIVYRNK